jgi:hypothetical protein
VGASSARQRATAHSQLWDIVAAPSAAPKKRNCFGQEATTTGRRRARFAMWMILIDALIRLMQTGDDVVGPFNIDNPIEFSVLQLAELVLKLTGSKSRIVHRKTVLSKDSQTSRRPKNFLGGNRSGLSKRVLSRLSNILRTFCANRELRMQSATMRSKVHW